MYTHTINIKSDISLSQEYAFSDSMSVRAVACLLVLGFLSCLGEAIITTIAKVPTKASTISVTPTPKVKVVAILEVIWDSQTL